MQKYLEFLLLIVFILSKERLDEKFIKSECLLSIFLHLKD